MAYIFFDSSYVPCGFLIVRKDGNPYKETDTVSIQTDWDYPAIASRMGFIACNCGSTDGTIDCKHKTASEMISQAYDHIKNNEGEEFELLDEYFQ